MCLGAIGALRSLGGRAGGASKIERKPQTHHTVMHATYTAC
jgi:hypothetical protein